MKWVSRDTQKTDSYTDKRPEEARSFCRLSPLFNTDVFVIDFGVMSGKVIESKVILDIKSGFFMPLIDSLRSWRYCWVSRAQAKAAKPRQRAAQPRVAWGLSRVFILREHPTAYEFLVVKFERVWNSSMNITTTPS